MTNVITDQNILIRVLKTPGKMAELSVDEWNELLIEAKIANLAGRLAADATDLGIRDQLPKKVQNLFKSFDYQSASSTRMIKWEMNRVKRALKDEDDKIILLKGAAYIAKGLRCTRGRISVDLDILLKKNRIDFAEEKFLAAGWKHHVEHDYDQKFYREYSHELPPLIDPDRQISIDVHHSILPITSRVYPDMNKLFENAEPCKDGYYTFSNVDIILHSVVHLFQDGEVRSSLRNLLEQHDMFEEFGDDPEFWQQLVPRAQELGFTGALYYALRYTKMILGTNIPEHVFNDIAPFEPNIFTKSMMDWMVPGVISPTIGAQGLPRWISMNGLYLRSHWLRMPFGLLLKHLGTKTMMRIKGEA